MARSLKDLYNEEKPSGEKPWKKGKFHGPYRPDTVLLTCSQA